MKAKYLPSRLVKNQLKAIVVIKQIVFLQMLQMDNHIINTVTQPITPEKAHKIMIYLPTGLHQILNS